MISPDLYARRRKQLAAQLENNSILILPGAKEIIRNGDVCYPFRQNSDFYYLTGFNEPEAVLVLLKHRQQVESLCFHLPKNPLEEQWSGKRTSDATLKKDYLFDEADSIDLFIKKLPALLDQKKIIYLPLQQRETITLVQEAQKKIHKTKRCDTRHPHTLIDCLPLIHEMRLFKSEEEIALIAHAVDITTLGHLHVMAHAKPQIHEYALDAWITSIFKQHGAKETAYGNIVASGKNTCTLHYTANNKKIGTNDLVLVDAGAEYGNYAADITRTFPANGRFSKDARAIYEIVLEAQSAGIAALKPGSTWELVQKAVVKVITAGLKATKYLHGDLKKLIEKKAYLPFYMHGAGHYLGLDVHDVGSYAIHQQSRPFEAGMVLTIEPGIYIAKRGLGVRIEDDVLITKKGARVLSHSLPKTVEDIEAIMNDL